MDTAELLIMIISILYDYRIAFLGDIAISLMITQHGK